MTGGAGSVPDGSVSMPESCLDVVCQGQGECIVESGIPTCVCDYGYKLDDAGTECIVDEDCINVRLLEDGCRQKLEAEPAMGLFIAVETCAGTAARPDKLGPLNGAFAVTADGTALSEESAISVIERDVESYVTFAIDLSASVIEDGDAIGPLIEEIDVMVEELRGPPGAPRVSISLIAFGRFAENVLPFTTDIDLVQDRLAEIATDPDSFISDVNGTDLNGAVNLGSRELEDAMEARSLETGGDALVTGTLVAITDGDDTSARALSLSPRVNFISVGISDEVNSDALKVIGSQGAFRAPTQAQWGDTFALVSTRVKQYPDSAYLLGYCSPALVGAHTLEVGVAFVEAAETASCSFCALAFGDSEQCNVAFFENYCEARPTCGSFLACGGCEELGTVEDSWQLVEEVTDAECVQQ